MYIDLHEQFWHIYNKWPFGTPSPPPASKLFPEHFCQYSLDIALTVGTKGKNGYFYKVGEMHHETFRLKGSCQGNNSVFTQFWVAFYLFFWVIWGPNSCEVPCNVCSPPPKKLTCTLLLKRCCKNRKQILDCNLL